VLRSVAVLTLVSDRCSSITIRWVSTVFTNARMLRSPAATSSATVSVIDIVPTNSSVPTISGTAQVGQTLTATTGTWTHNPTSFTYQWKRAGTAIGGATGLTYVPVTGDVPRCRIHEYSLCNANPARLVMNGL